MPGITGGNGRDFRRLIVVAVLLLLTLRRTRWKPQQAGDTGGPVMHNCRMTESLCRESAGPEADYDFLSGLLYRQSGAPRIHGTPGEILAANRGMDTPVTAEKAQRAGAVLSPGCYSGSLTHAQPRDSSSTGRTTWATDESASWATTRRS
jgi:hypothetical protein